MLTCAKVTCCSLLCSQVSLCFQDVLVQRTGLTMHACVAQVDRLKKHTHTHFRCSGAFRLNAEGLSCALPCPQNKRISAWDFAEGVMREMQQVSAGHQAAHEALQTIHQETSLLRSQIDTRSRFRLVEPQSLMPDRFGTKSGPSWRTWPFLARDTTALTP